MSRLSRFAVTVVVAGGLGLAAWMSPAAHAQGPSYQGGNCPQGLTCTHWCPGDAVPPGSHVLQWDWNVCHDWYWNSDGIVDVTTNTIYPWNGTPRQAPPPPVITGTPPAPLPKAPVFCTPRGSLIIIPPICDEIGY